MAAEFRLSDGAVSAASAGLGRAGCWGPLRTALGWASPGGVWCVGGGVCAAQVPCAGPQTVCRAQMDGQSHFLWCRGLCPGLWQTFPGGPLGGVEPGSRPLAKKWRRPNLQPESLAEGLGAASSRRKGWVRPSGGGVAQAAWPMAGLALGGRSPHLPSAFPTPGGAEGRASSQRPPPRPLCLWSWWVSPCQPGLPTGIPIRARAGAGAGGAGRQHVWGGPCTWGPWAWRWGRPSGPRESTCERKLVGG